MRKPLSAETLYLDLYVLPRGTLRSELLWALRQARKTRWPRARGIDHRGQLPHITPIADQPAEVIRRQVHGPWEGNLLNGARTGSRLSAHGSSKPPSLSSWPSWTVQMAGGGVPGMYQEASVDLCRDAENADG
ncbi:MAG: hypothetical protein E8D52_15120 [Nitrospira sp.]|nr:MAG: hypothetical protein E8D52_15120 [Nitrospira sp.]